MEIPLRPPFSKGEAGYRVPAGRIQSPGWSDTESRLVVDRVPAGRRQSPGWPDTESRPGSPLFEKEGPGEISGADFGLGFACAGVVRGFNIFRVHNSKEGSCGGGSGSCRRWGCEGRR